MDGLGDGGEQTREEDQRERSRAVAGTVALILVIVLALLNGCGGGRSEAKTMTVVGTEMAFDAPDSVAAGEYDVTFRNDGAVYHELAFRDPDGTFVARRSIAAGERVTMHVKLEPGLWELGCYEPGHYESGMHRTLDVER